VDADRCSVTGFELVSDEKVGAYRIGISPKEHYCKRQNSNVHFPDIDINVAIYT